MSRAVAKAVMPNDGMNRTERRYAAHLADLHHAGKVQTWKREPLSLRLGANTHYQPDFLVVNEAGEIEMHEVKSSLSANSDRYRNAGRVGWAKVKIAADLFPFRFVLVTPDKSGGWNKTIL